MWAAFVEVTGQTVPYCLIALAVWAGIKWQESRA